MNNITNALVLCLGIVIIVIGIIGLVLLSKLIVLANKNINNIDNTVLNSQKTILPDNNFEIINRQEFIAAVSAAIAEDMGTDISGIRILSVKKV